MDFFEKKKDPVILARIQTLYLQDKSASYIAKDVGMSKKQILGRIRKFKKFGTMVQRPIPGRPRKTTSKEDFLIVHQALQDPLVSSVSIKKDLPDLHVSESTILRRLHEKGRLGSFWAIKKPKLSSDHRKKRLQWAAQHQNWTISQWNQVLWSDECTFYQWSSRKFRIWRPLHSGYKKKYIQPSVSHPAKINVWGCFSGHGLGVLVPIDGNLNASQYVQILDKNLRGVVERLYEHEEWYLMQDNSPIHNANRTYEYLEKKGVSLLDWPAYSPDLNPIENVWGEMKRRLQFCRPRNAVELQKCVENIWNNLSEEYITNLLKSMPNRVLAVIAKKGEATKY